MHSRPTKNTGYIRYWALIVSAVIHIVALGVFAGIKLSGISQQSQPQRSAMSMEMIQKAVETPKPKPKPKVEPIPKIEKPPVEAEKTPLVIPEAIPPEPDPAPEPVPTDVTPELIEPMPAAPVHEVEFFGQKSIVQRICYVVDCSGSMYGQMYRVKKQLKKSVLNLNSEQAFSILFFMDGKEILMTGSAALSPATTKAKSEALKLIDQVRPGGMTDAMHALECAMRLRGPGGKSPEVVYFLTDGFNLDQSGAFLFVEKVDRLRKSLAPSAVMHTIGFWPQKTDKQMLKLLAEKSGGSYIEGIKQ
ncbi:MAG: vWA domain-containing protein [Planctomycetota bacterium]